MSVRRGQHDAARRAADTIACEATQPHAGSHAVGGAAAAAHTHRVWARARRHTRSGGCSGGDAHAPRLGTRWRRRHRRSEPEHRAAPRPRPVRPRARRQSCRGRSCRSLTCTCARANALGISGLRGGGTMGRGVERSGWGDLDGQAAGLHTAARPVCRAQTLPRARLCRARGQPRACEFAVRTPS